MKHAEMVIFTRTFDFLAWLLPTTNHFPRTVRHTFSARLLNCAFNLREQLEEANHRSGAERYQKLLEADESLAKIRMYLRLAVRMNWLKQNQYQHSAKMLDEIGRLLGGWLKSVKRR